MFRDMSCMFIFQVRDSQPWFSASVFVFLSIGVHAPRKWSLEWNSFSTSGSDGRQHGRPSGWGAHLWQWEYHYWYVAVMFVLCCSFIQYVFIILDERLYGYYRVTTYFCLFHVCNILLLSHRSIKWFWQCYKNSQNDGDQIWHEWKGLSYLSDYFCLLNIHSYIWMLLWDFIYFFFERVGCIQTYWCQMSLTCIFSCVKTFLSKEKY